MTKILNQILYKSSYCALAFVVLVITFISLITSVNCIPSESFKTNIYESYQILKEEGIYPRMAGNLFWQLDNFTDAIMLNEAYTCSDKEPFEAALLSNYAVKSEDSDIILYNPDETNFLKTVSYARYWHGYLISLKPLLCFFNYKEIRIFNYIIFSFLLTLLCFLLYKKLPKIYCISFIISLLIFQFPIIPLSLQFSTCYLIAISSCILILSFPRISDSFAKQKTIFFVIGGCVAFFDFLTTPIITFGYALVILFGLRHSDKLILRTVILFVFWLLGYSSIWISKWILVFMFTDYPILTDVFDNINHRISDVNEVLIKYKDSTVYLLMACTVLLFIAFAYYLIIKYNKVTSKYYYLIIVAFAPLLWFGVLRNHSLLHIFFTYRSFSITAFSLLIFFYKIHIAHYGQNCNTYTLSE